MAKQAGFFEQHWTDADGNPAGGVTTTRGLTISWQNGPLGRVGSPERMAPNGAFVEDGIAALKGRFLFYQEASDGKFACEENAKCIALLEQMEEVCEGRTRRRIAAKTEGTHEGN